MSISEEIALKDGVSSPARKALSALNGIASAIERVKAAGAGLGGIAADVQKIALASSAGKLAEAAAKADAKVRTDAVKSALKNQEALAKAKLAAELDTVKSANKIDQINAKGAAKFQLEQQKAVHKVILDGHKASHEVFAKNVANENKALDAQAQKANTAAKARAGTGGGGGKAGGAGAGAAGGGGAAEGLLALLQGKGLTGALEGFGLDKSQLAVLGTAAGLLTGIVATLGAIAAKLASMAFDLTKAGLSLAIDAVSFKENTVLGFEAVLGSAKRASALYEKAMDLADKIGLDKGVVMRRLTQLISEGMGEKQALAVTKAVADVTQVLGAQKGQKLEKVFEQVQAKGKFDETAIKQLQKAGFNTEEIYKRLAKAMGKTVEQTKLLVKAGKVDAKTGINATTGAVEKQVGGRAEKAGESVPRLLGDIGDEFARLFDSIDLGPLKEFLKGVSDALTGPAGQELKKGVTEFFNAVVDALFGAFKDPKGKVDIANVVRTMGKALKAAAADIRTATPAIQAVAGAIVALFGTAQGGGAEKAATIWEGLKGIFAPIIQIGSAALQGIGIIVALIERINAMSDAIESGGFAAIAQAIADFDISSILGGITNELMNFAAEILPASIGVGVAIVQGLAEGIASGASWVVSQIVSVAIAAIQAAKAALGVASPSRVFDAIGGFTAQGMAQGIDGGRSQVARSARALAAAAVASGTPGNDNGARVPSARPGAGGGEGGGAPGSGVVVHLNVQVNAGNAGSPQEVAAAVGDATERAAVRVFRRIANRG